MTTLNTKKDENVKASVVQMPTADVSTSKKAPTTKNALKPTAKAVAAKVAANKAKAKKTSSTIFIAGEIDKVTNRNFYVIKEGNDGNEAAYAFESVYERSRWLERHRSQNVRVATAKDVYRMLKKDRREAFIANRNNRVSKIGLDQTFDTSKGQRLISNK